MATTSRSGAGGKIVTNRRKQRLSATPYDRHPPPPPPNKSPNWFSGVVVPSARAIASGAGKILSSLLTESESSSSEDEDYDSEEDVDNEIADGANAANEKNLVSADMMQHGEVSQLNVKRTGSKQIIEKLILQETFTREECDSIIKLLNSRVVDPAENSLLVGSPGKNQDVEMYDKVTQEAKKWYKDKKAGSASVAELAPGTSKVESGGASPVDVARSYMKERPRWASPTQNIDVRTPFPSKLFMEGASYSVGYDSFSSSKKRSLASGSWNIQEELQRVRAKATENMLRTPPKKLDPSVLGAGKLVSSGQKSSYPQSVDKTWPFDVLVKAGVSSEPAFAALESRQDGQAEEALSTQMATTVSKNNQKISEAACADDDLFGFKSPSVQNHDVENHADPNSSEINGPKEPEMAEFIGRQSTNGVSLSQPSLSAGIESGQNHEQHSEVEGNHISRSATEENSVIDTSNKQVNSEIPNDTYTEVPIVTETDGIASGSQNDLGLQNEELSIDVSIPSIKDEVDIAVGKKQDKKTSKPSRRGRGRGSVKG